MKILTISNYFPYPPQDGTKIQIFQRIKYLSESHRVTLLCVVDQEPDPGLVAAMTTLLRSPRHSQAEGPALRRCMGACRQFPSQLYLGYPVLLYRRCSHGGTAMDPQGAGFAKI